jgi:ketosteroid isomerase-like protein
MSENLERLKDAFACWNDRKGDREAIDKWMGLFAEPCTFRTMGDGRAGMELTRLAQSKQEVRGFFESLTGSLRMIHFTPHIYVEQGDRIAVLGSTAWTNPATGASTDTLIATFWRFEDGKIVELYQLFDTAELLRLMGQPVA